MFPNILSTSLAASILAVSLIPTATEAICFKAHPRESAPSAIHINSSRTIPLHTKTRLTFYNAILDVAKLTNTGKSFIGLSVQILDPSYITGGVLCNKLYKVYSIRFDINPHVNGTSGNTFDGKSVPLQMTVIYYNVLSGTFEEALKHPDGIVAVSFPVKIGKIPNLLFIPLQIILKTGVLNKPGSSIFVPGLFLYPWFNNILTSLTYKYYAYQGAIYDPKTGKSIPVATVIQIILDQALGLSFSQFAELQNIMGQDGTSLNSASPTSPQGDIKVYSGKSIIEFITPF